MLPNSTYFALLAENMKKMGLDTIAKPTAYAPSKPPSASGTDLLKGVAQQLNNPTSAAKTAYNLGSSLGGGVELAGTAAENAAWNAAANNATFNLGAELAAGAPPSSLGGLGSVNAAGISPAPQLASSAPGGFSLSGIGSAGNYFLPIAGGLGAIDLFANKRHGGRGALQGAASGAAMGSYFGPAGAGIGALLGGGAGYFGNLGDKDRWKEEQDRVRKLADSGVTGWSELAKTYPTLTQGRSRDELIALELAKKNAGQYSNEAFAKSRNEADLRPEDIWGFSTFGEKYGNDWLGKFSEQQRRDIAQQYLDAGAVNEAKGQIELKTNPDLEAKIQAYLEGKK